MIDLNVFPYVTIMDAAAFGGLGISSLPLGSLNGRYGDLRRGTDNIGYYADLQIRHPLDAIRQQQEELSIEIVLIGHSIAKNKRQGIPISSSYAKIEFQSYKRKYSKFNDQVYTSISRSETL